MKRKLTVPLIDVTQCVLEEQPLASDGLDGWPRKVRIALAADRALRNIGNLPREARDAEKEKQ